MSVPQYLRKISLKIGDAGEAIDLSDLRIRFAVRRGDISTPNSADIRVYNVSDETAYKIQKEFTRVRLEAGYEGNYGLLFDGTVRQLRRGRESQTDTYIDITAADGDSAYNFAVMNMTLAAGSTADDHMAAVLRVMGEKGVTQGFTHELPKNKLPRAKVMYGMARNVLRDMARTTGTSWSIQDGKLITLYLDSFLPGDPVVVTSLTGMIGLPEQTINGINVRMLLNPSVKIGGRIQIDNASLQLYRHGLGVDRGTFSASETVRTYSKLNSDGMYRVLISEHHGDNRGNEWYTDTICITVDMTGTSPSLIGKDRGAPANIGSVKPYG